VRNNNGKAKKVDKVIKYVNDHGGIEYASGIMNRYYQESMDILDEFEDSEYKTALSELVRYTIEREK